LRLFSSRGIRFSGDSIKSCVGFIDIVDSTKNIVMMEGFENIRKYYSLFINSISNLVSSSSAGGRVIKNIGDCILFYFPKTSDINDTNSFQTGIECCFKILDERYKINNELARQHLPPFNYRITIDYGVLDLALVGDYSQIDLFGPTINLCSKINSSLSTPNELIIGDTLYRVLNSFPSATFAVSKYYFINNREYKITETNKYPTYNIRRTNNHAMTITNNNNKKDFLTKKQLSSFKENENRFFFHKRNNAKRVILVDDEQDILFTYRMFLRAYDYHIISFTDPTIALNYIRNIPNFDNLLVILDIRMKDLKGFQLYQQIKSIDSSIKILFVTSLDILDELLSLVPGVIKEQMRKPVDKKLFTNTVNKLLLN
jgi:CheY-like chemotaxis protein/class 3 adenylate cyclase